MNTISTITLECGLTLVVEPIPSVASVALNWLLPVGAASDPPEGDGYAAILSEMIFRGAGGLSSREHSEALDRLGVQRSSDVAAHHLAIRATLLGSKLADALPLLVSMVREPALAADDLEPVRSLSLQALESLDDDPQHLVMIRLGEQHRPPPLNRHGFGDRAALERATLEALRSSWRARAVPRGSILAIAGAVDPQTIAAQLNRLLSGWTGEAAEIKPSGPARRGTLHVQQSSSQVHIALAYDAPAEPEPTSMLERLATNVLSGGSSGRLFTEVRQKRSLCYSVGASYRGGRDDGLVALYAGTTPERAQETLDVCRSEIERMKAGAEREEFDRAAVGLKSHLVMSGESTNARAAAIGHDVFRLGRARSLDEIAAQIDAITLDALNAYLAKRAFGEFTMVSIGPTALG